MHPQSQLSQWHASMALFGVAGSNPLVAPSASVHTCHQTVELPQPVLRKVLKAKRSVSGSVTAAVEHTAAARAKAEADTLLKVKAAAEAKGTEPPGTAHLKPGIVAQTPPSHPPPSAPPNHLLAPLLAPLSCAPLPQSQSQLEQAAGGGTGTFHWDTLGIADFAGVILDRMGGESALKSRSKYLREVLCHAAFTLKSFKDTPEEDWYGMVSKHVPDEFETEQILGVLADLSLHSNPSPPFHVAVPLHDPLTSLKSAAVSCSTAPLSALGAASLSQQLANGLLAKPEAKSAAEAKAVAEAKVAAEALLPMGWAKHIAPASGRTFYAHAVTGQSQWELPSAETKTAAEAKAAAESFSTVIASTPPHAIDPPRWRYRENPRPELTCTQLCRANVNGEYCEFYAAGKCWFAHNDSELRCLKFACSGVCPYLERCRRLHVSDAPYDAKKVRSCGRPPSGSSLAYTRVLGSFPLPSTFSCFLPQNCDRVRDSRESAVKGLTHLMRQLPPMDQRATRDDIAKRLSNMQFAEELFNMIDIMEYQMRCVQIERHKNETNSKDCGRDLFDIKVAGLAENRPSVLRGDELHVYLHAADAWFGAKIHFVHRDFVTAALPHDFVWQWCSDSLCDVVFTISRTQDRVRHDAIHKAPFPSTAWCLVRSSPPSVHRGIAVAHPRALNDKQKQVAALVSSGVRGTLVWGPPGTGKTTALVAAIAETLVSDPACRILVCAPSNDAADLIVDRLHEGYARSCPLSMLRLNGASRLVKVVNYPNVLLYSLQDCAGGFMFPDVAQLTTYRLVVCTLMTSGKLGAVGVPEQHFTHLFVDEAGHSTEADLMVALQSAPNVKHMMLAGDHKQLGAIVRAPPCIEAGMQVSPLERLQSDPLMQDQVVMLTQNYRSHPAIVQIVNVMYDDKLVPVAPADPVLRHPNLSVEIQEGSKWLLPMTNDCPVLFLHHRGIETRESDSPSWCNVSEANMLISIALDLHDRHGVPFCDIAIISPYRKQVAKISGLLRDKFKKRQEAADDKSVVVDVKVSTVEMFQGRESRVVLISCVRNDRDENVDTEGKFGIGFLKQPQRANVALSRAKSLMVIAGNAGLMGECIYWRKILERIIALPSPCMWDATKSQPQQLRIIPKPNRSHRGTVALLDAITSAQEERPFDRVA